MIEYISQIATPDISFALLTLGVYGLFFEMVIPGVLLPGITGAICLLLGITSLSMLPLDYNGVWLMLFGFALITGEVILPAFGILALAGTLVFGSGAYILVDREVYGSGISLWLISFISTLTLAMIFYVCRIYIKSIKAPITTGSEGLKGSEGKVINWAGYEGEINASGAIWKAKSLSGTGFKPNDKITVREIDGLTLIIEKYKNEENKK